MLIKSNMMKTSEKPTTTFWIDFSLYSSLFISTIWI